MDAESKLQNRSSAPSFFFFSSAPSWIALHSFHAAFPSEPGLVTCLMRTTRSTVEGECHWHKLQEFNIKAELEYQFWLNCLQLPGDHVLGPAFVHRDRKGLAAVEQEVRRSGLNRSVWNLADSGIVEAKPGLHGWVLAESGVVTPVQIPKVVLREEEGMSVLAFLWMFLLGQEKPFVIVSLHQTGSFVKLYTIAYCHSFYFMRTGHALSPLTCLTESELEPGDGAPGRLHILPCARTWVQLHGPTSWGSFTSSRTVIQVSLSFSLSSPFRSICLYPKINIKIWIFELELYSVAFD